MPASNPTPEPAKKRQPSSKRARKRSKTSAPPSETKQANAPSPGYAPPPASTSPPPPATSQPDGPPETLHFTEKGNEASSSESSKTSPPPKTWSWPIPDQEPDPDPTFSTDSEECRAYYAVNASDEEFATLYETRAFRVFRRLGKCPAGRITETPGHPFLERMLEQFGPAHGIDNPNQKAK